jgi:DNA-binding IclR family transcriptional regulator
MDEQVESNATGVRSVGRALEILSLFNEDHGIIGLREIQEETGLARTTLIRILSTLEDYGLLWSMGTNRYSPGPGLLHWGKLAGHMWQLPADSQRALRELVESTKETASIWVRQGTRRVCVAQHESSQALRHVVRVGREGPLWAAATGRVLMLDLPENELTKIAAEGPGVQQVPLMLSWQAEVRKQGYALSHGEREDGLSVLAVPLAGKSGRVLAALTLTGPTDRFGPSRIDGHLSAIRETAAAIAASGFINSRLANE